LPQGDVHTKVSHRAPMTHECLLDSPSKRSRTASLTEANNSYGRAHQLKL
jgi:hypothetical protein